MLIFLFCISFEKIEIGESFNTNAVAFGYNDKFATGDEDSVRIYNADFVKVGNIPISSTKSLISADVNNDGYRDLIISNGDLYVFRGIMDTVYFGKDGKDVDICDIDSDGVAEIILATSSGLYAYKVIGDGNYSVEMISSSIVDKIITARINNNLIPDIVMYGEQGVKILYDVDSEISIFSDTVNSVSLLDYDSDLDVDIVIFSQDSCIMFKNEEGVLSYDKSCEMVVSASFSVDIDIDGDVDIVMLNGNNLSIMENINGIFHVDLIDTVGVCNAVYSIDIDYDGRRDIFIAKDGKNLLFKNTDDASGVSMNFNGRGKGLSPATSIPLLVEYAGTAYLVSTGSGTTGAGDYREVFPVNSFIKVKWQSGVVDTLRIEEKDSLLKEDIYPPFPITELICTSHTENLWSSEDSVKIYWSQSSDPLGSGVKGYSYLFSHSSGVAPDTIVDIEYPDTTLGIRINEGINYFTISVIDVANNVSEKREIGPLLIDTSPPLSPEVIYPIQDTVLPKGPVYFKWTKGEDTLSGIKDYTLLIYKDSLLFVREDSLTIDSTNVFLFLSSGRKFFKVLTRDNVNNAVSTDLISFNVDTIPPYVRYTHPESATVNQHTNTNIMVLFSDKMDSTTVNSSNFSVMSISYGRINGDIKKEGDFYIFVPDNSLYPEDKLVITLSGNMKDVAGNSLDGNHNGIAEGSPEDDYVWWFETGKNPDTIPPVINDLTASPNPTKGDTIVEVKVIASDIERGNSPIKIIELFIDIRKENGTGILLEPSDGVFDSPEEEGYVNFDISSLSIGIHKIYVHTQDASQNWSSYDSLILIVSDNNTESPQFTFSLQKDTFMIGEHIKGSIKSTKKLVRFSLTLSDSVNIVIPVTTSDSINFGIDWKVEEIYPERYELIFEGEDSDGNIGISSLPVLITTPPKIIVRENTYIVPNPVKSYGNATIYFYVTSPCEVVVDVYTMDGRRIYSKKKNIDRGGQFDSIVITTDDFNPGLYMVKITADTGREKESMIKRMGIIR